MPGMRSIAPVVDQAGVGVVVPHDMVLDRELWRWVPDDVSLYFARTPHVPLAVTAEMVAMISAPDRVAGATHDLVATGSEVHAYACTSGSFLRGMDGERSIVEAMHVAGAPVALTTSGALLQALAHLGVTRVAVATPYDDELTVRLGEFLHEAGVSLVGGAHLGLSQGICRVPYEITADLVRRADSAEAEAVVVSCTNLPTYDLIAPLEAELGKPVVTANQATVWASLRVLGRRGVGPGQRLLT